MSLCSRLPEDVAQKAKSFGLEESVAENYLERFLAQMIHRAKDVVDPELSRQVFPLDDDYKQKKPPRSKKKVLSARHKRKFKVYDITGDVQSYESYIPLQRLWLQYFRQVIGLHKQNPEKVSSNTQLMNNLLKADYHGCIMKVTRSKCPSYVGLSGIMLQETRNTMKFITKENRLKTIPKMNCVFTFEVDGFTFTIHGKHFRVKSSERSVKKFKSKSTLEL